MSPRDHQAEAAAADRSHPERWPAFVAAMEKAIANLGEGEDFIPYTEVARVVPKNSRSYYHARLQAERPDLAAHIRRRKPTTVRRQILPPAAVGEPLQPWIVASSLAEEAKVLTRLAVEAEEAAAVGDEHYFTRARQIIERLSEDIEQLSQIIEDPVRRRDVASR